MPASVTPGLVTRLRAGLVIGLVAHGKYYDGPVTGTSLTATSLTATTHLPLRELLVSYSPKSPSSELARSEMQRLYYCAFLTLVGIFVSLSLATSIPFLSYPIMSVIIISCVLMGVLWLTVLVAVETGREMRLMANADRLILPEETS